MGKKFMGLDGTDHFWDRAKVWILNQITSAGMDKQSIIDAVYPVGSLYWSSKDTDPSTLFGGTWVQIKDRFVLACGDTYKTTGATGGASTVTLSVSNMPSHNHTFTPSGTITMNSHSHGLNGHTHSFSWSGSHNHKILSGNSTGWAENVVAVNTSRSNTVIGGYEEHGARTYHNKNTSNQEFIENKNISISGTTGGNSGNTTSTTSTGSFSGTQGTTSPEGGGTSFSILPPYVVKYCWERTA